MTAIGKWYEFYVFILLAKLDEKLKWIFSNG
jgi:hypothetical protein